MGSLYIVPPPNNFAWPEVGIYEQLIAAGGRPFLTLEKTNYGGYSGRALLELSQNFNRRLKYTPNLSDEDVLLFCEAFTTDALQVRVLYAMTERPSPRIVGLMLGGSFIPGDTMALAPAIESAVLSAYDLTIAPTGVARRDQRVAYPRIPCAVKNLPIDGTLVGIISRPASERHPTIVFPHRQIYEKGWPLWQELRVQKQMRGVQFVATKDAPLAKHPYWELLGQAKAVFASPIMETYGIAVEEAMAAGCCPVLLECPVYLELYKDHMVHWHTGSVASATHAIQEAMTCQLEHYEAGSVSIERTMTRRAKEILTCAASLGS